MAVRPGEETTAVLFADIHYFYGPPTAKPPHHRFDKGSYVYLFENASYRRARIEVANNAGTEDQDAFDGYLDSTHFAYSYKHPNLVTLTVDSPNARSNAPRDEQEWHLPTYDPQNKNKYMYRLHTLDLYFWTATDALLFLTSIRRVLPSSQISIVGEPVAPRSHREEMSPIVQKLENVAISDPEYQGGRTRNSQTTSSSFPGPPVSAPAPVVREEVPSFVPMAYNPAAPAAPETIAHREKTPPLDDGAGNPLLSAAAVDQGQFQSFGIPYKGGGFSGPPSGVGFSGPPQAQAQAQAQSSQQGYFPASPTVVTPVSPYAMHFQHSFAGPPTAVMGGKDSPYAQPPPSSASSAAPPYHAALQAQGPVNHWPGSPGFSSVASTPTVTSPGFTGPPSASTSGGFTGPPSAPVYTTAPAPPGGFSQYQYKNLSNTQPLMTDYSIHQEVYRPTQGEATKKVKVGKEERNGNGPRGKLEQRADKLERGMGSLFKKLEKKIG